jgi:small conductance mechanosensitive channel
VDSAGKLLDNLSPLGRWAVDHGSRILLILVIGIVAYRLFYILARRVKVHVQGIDGAPNSTLDMRAETLFKVITNAALVAVITAATLMILQELDVQIGPLLASVGIVGLALGLGAQTLVSDVISGLFILIENQYGVGDVVEINGLVGTVEEMTLRVTYVRDLEGALHIIPNGEIRTVSNRSRDWSRAIIDVGINYDADVDRALETLQEIGRDLMVEPTLGAVVVEEPTVTGIEGIEEGQLRLRFMVKTEPLQQFSVERFLRREIQRAFPARGLELATPRQRVTLVRDGEAGTST